MKLKTGRPARKDNPQRITINLSAKHFKLLEKHSAMLPSRGFYIEKLIEADVAAKGAVK